MSAWGGDADAWASWLRASGKPPSTVYLRTYHVRRFCDAHPGISPWNLTVDDLAEWLGSHDWAPETRRSHRASLRTFYHWAHITGRITTDPAALLPPVKVPAGKPRPAPDDVYRAALGQASPREWLMLRLAANEGLRRGEIARAHTADVEPDLAGWSLRVVGKGGRVRLVPLLDDLAREIRALPAGFLFPGQIDGHLSPAWVGKVMSRVLGPGWTAHSLRHLLAARAYAHERDLRAVQVLLGHASITTTQRYTPVPDGALRAAIHGAA